MNNIVGQSQIGPFNKNVLWRAAPAELSGLCASDEVLSCLRQERSKHENPVQNVVTVTAQEPAYLHCRIPEGSNHMVAWTRASDQALLTAGQHSFTSDPRFQVSRKSDTDWILILSVHGFERFEAAEKKNPATNLIAVFALASVASR
ncbi:hypothetical protein ANCCEY_06383 [Ancylostoma ceylanicum]|uniref:Ig-like domain-containing protein n=1 Tax=Ancylostoma ceylanicum TaxID=53326 RepID=A0A0D6LWQ2_9BILA|nr:hypothetical protein ANCCEY_06383 [Ancylostoma ceylanicum]